MAVDTGAFDEGIPKLPGRDAGADDNDNAAKVKASVDDQQSSRCPEERVTRTAWNEDAVPLQQYSRLCKSHRCRVSDGVDVEALRCY